MSPTDLAARADAYRDAFPQFPDSHLTVSDRWMQGMWLLGNNYQGSGYYGAYPPGYLRRIMAMFSDAERVLHLFSGSLKGLPVGHIAVDLQVNGTVRPHVQANGHYLPFLPGSFDVAIVDPPYSPEDAKRYGTTMVNRVRVLHALWEVVKPQGHLVWLDTQVPMFSKALWHWYGAITIVRSTNHRVRLVSLFERV